jgi:hypothetical protein
MGWVWVELVALQPAFQSDFAPVGGAVSCTLQRVATRCRPLPRAKPQSQIGCGARETRQPLGRTVLPIHPIGRREGRC